MTSPLTFAIILITCIVSIISFNNSNVKKELILSPYKVLNEKKVEEFKICKSNAKTTSKILIKITAVAFCNHLWNKAYVN